MEKQNKPFIYTFNDTMKLLGNQNYFWMLSPDGELSKEYQDIMKAHFECDEYGDLEKSIKSLLYDVLVDFFNLGVITGKRLARKHKK